jgi:hypothetical protein
MVAEFIFIQSQFVHAPQSRYLQGIMMNMMSKQIRMPRTTQRMSLILSQRWIHRKNLEAKSVELSQESAAERSAQGSSAPNCALQ